MSSNSHCDVIIGVKDNRIETDILHNFNIIEPPVI